MARLMKILKTLRNHWKKSTFAGCLIAYGASYLNERHRTNLLMRAFCEEAKVYGERTLPTGLKPRHVTVIVNPTAKDGKGKIQYEKYAAPLFHLAGIKVSYFQTEYQGQAKGLMEVMESTDAVVIAGGDGTLHEAVTGLMSREDYATASKMYPIGVIPSGKTNTLSRSLFWQTGMTDARWIAESAMAVVREQVDQLDVLRVTLDPASAEEPATDVEKLEKPEKPKEVYAVAKLEHGVFRDADLLVPKYWYFGMLKAKAAYFFQAIKEKPRATIARLGLVRPCEGCSKCYVPPKEEVCGSTGRWWSVFLPRSAPQAVTASGPDYSRIENEDCGTWHYDIVEACSLELSANRKEDQGAVSVAVGPPLMGRTEFMQQGWRRHSKTPGTTKHLLFAKDVDLKFETPEPENKEEEETPKTKLSIDSVEYQADRVIIQLFPRALNVYCTRQ
uniref:Acylglycerol kinase, mitochondrial n=1 Tax=Ornithodoros turicata TaxID=34597 RepID=A0A2R5LNC1_9ACAR